MIQTNNKNSLNLEISNSSVSVFPGAARLGNILYPYRGGLLSFNQMTHFGGDSSKYQNSLLFINPLGSSADLTTALSATASSIRELTLPTLPSDSTNVYSTGYPLGMFTFYTPDGSNSQLVTYSKI